MTKPIITDAFEQMQDKASEAEWKEFFILVKSIAINESFEAQPEVQMTMAILYENGMGVMKNIEKAIDWYTKAAERGLIEAQYLLGDLYDTYYYIDENYQQKSAKWTEKAAEKGHVKAQYKLSYVYNYGKGVDKDHKQATKWCRKAAEQV